MLGDFAGVVYSVLLIGFFLIIGWFVRKKSDFVARKIVHIGVSNWYFIYANCFSTWYMPVAGLLAFGFLNFLFEMKKEGKKSWGTVYYPLVIACCIYASSLGKGNSIATGCALLGMGYGDGLAAIAGKFLGRTKMPGSETKTTVGSLTVLVCVFIVVLVLSGTSFGTALLIAAVASLAECYSPGKLDNILVPVLIFTMVRWLC